MFDRITSFVRQQLMLCIALAAAAVTTTIAGTGPSEVAQSIDYRVLALLLCLMTSVAGLVGCGVLDRMARQLLGRARSTRTLRLALVLLPFFCSMLVTNDVALLIFVPFAITSLRMAGRQDELAHLAACQAVSANLGSMVTPIGNPQNLFLYLRFGIDPIEFFLAIAPYALLSLVLLVTLCVARRSQAVEKYVAPSGATGTEPKPSSAEGNESRRCLLPMHLALFSLSILTALRAVPWQLTLPVVLLAVLALDRHALSKVDWALLGTFACFFVFSHNMARIEAVTLVLGSAMGTAPFLTSLGASQVISNVPAAMLLSGFAQSWRPLLLGVDLGGLGTPVASLASLIAFRIYRMSPHSSARRFMLPFAALNVALLACLCLLYLAIG